jgi:hypothetical protein
MLLRPAVLSTIKRNPGMARNREMAKPFDFYNSTAGHLYSLKVLCSIAPAYYRL